MTSPPSTVTATPASVVLTLWNGVPVRKAIPRLRNARSRALEDASSSAATSRGSASTMVTSAPKLRHTLANSQPITPPPSTTTEAGTGSRRSACSEVRTRSPSISRPGSDAGVGAGGEHEVLAGVDLLAVGAGDGDLAVAGEPALALDDGDAAALDQPGQALEQPRDHAVLVGVDARHVDALERGAHAELRGLAGAVGDLGGVQQRLGRDAADVQAGAAELALLDEPDAQAELGRAQGAGVAARTRPEDEDVEVGHAGPSVLTCGVRAALGRPSLHYRRPASASIGRFCRRARERAGQTGAMAFLDRFRRGSRAAREPPHRWRPHRLHHGARLRQGRRAAPASRGSAERRGVEGFVEPRTAVSEVTLLLVAHDGEWTRRRVPSVEWAHDFCNKHQVPSYDAAVVGIPQRMRDYNSRVKQQRRRGLCSARPARAPSTLIVRANSTSVVTATPVPPLVTWPCGPPQLNDGPGDVEVGPGEAGGELAQERGGEQPAAPADPVVLGEVGDLAAADPLVHVLGDRHRPVVLAGDLGGGEHGVDDGRGRP